MRPILLNMNSPPLVRCPSRTRLPISIPIRAPLIGTLPSMNILIRGTHVQRPLLSLLARLLLRRLELALRRGVGWIECGVMLRELAVCARLTDLGALGVQLFAVPVIGFFGFFAKGQDGAEGTVGCC